MIDFDINLPLGLQEPLRPRESTGPRGNLDWVRGCFDWKEESKSEREAPEPFWLGR